MQARPGRRLLFLILTIGNVFVAKPALGRRFDLPAGPLTGGVARIGALTGDSIVAADAALLAGMGPAVHLAGDTKEALAALLRGSGAQALRVGGRTWKIVPQRRSVHREEQAPVSEAGGSIIVTGAKRVLPLSRYPAGIAIVDGQQLKRFGAVPDTATLSRLNPVLQSTHLGPGRDKLFLRGIADSSFNGAGATLVGLYFNDLRLAYSAPNPDLRLFDMCRVEVLEGPQGTLYGAGAMAGLVRMVPNVPVLDQAEGQIWSGGSLVAHGRGGGDVGGIANIPLAQGRSALRVVAYAAEDGGYIDDIGRGQVNTNQTHTLGGRSALRITLFSGWTVDIGGIVQNIRNDDAQYADRGFSPLTRDSVAAQPSYNLFRAGEVVAAGPLGAIEASSTTGIVGQSLGQMFLPEDGGATNRYRQTDYSRLISEEFRLSSRSGSAVQWVAGASALWGRTREIRTVESEGSVHSLGRGNTTVRDMTLYGEMTLRLRPRWTMTAGARFSLVRLGGVATGARVKSEDGEKLPSGLPSPFHGVRHEHFAIPSLAVGWTPSRDWLLFVRYSQGYRPGGQTASGIIQRSEADRLHSFEAGFRLIPDRAPFSAELSAVVSRWVNVQADVLEVTGLPETKNIGDGTVKSLNAQLHWKISEALEARVAGTVARGYVTGYDTIADTAIRTPLPDIARDTFVASLDYRRPLGSALLKLGFQANHIGRSVLGSGSELSQVWQGNYWIASGGGDLAVGATTWSLFLDNLLDSHANSFAFGAPTYRYDNSRTTPLRPRSIRLGIRHDF